MVMLTKSAILKWLFGLDLNLVLGSPESDDFIFCSLLHVAEVEALPMAPDGINVNSH
jgi:hypothetical protein